jgi:ribose/xylose/arabinose/galactoside ABC-type transport system permease subunit
MLLAAIGVVVVLANFLDKNHGYFRQPVESIHEIARYTALLGIYSLGATVVIICGGIDLSVGSMIALSATVCGSLLIIGHEWAKMLADSGSGFASTAAALVVPIAILGAIFSGFVVGTFHAWLISALRLPPFIATLATLVGLRSLARIICDGVTLPRGLVRTQINVNDPFFDYINAHIWVQVATFGVLAAITWFILSRTVLGRHLYAIGGNEQAARLSGIKADNIKWFAYAFAAITASIAGVLFVGNEIGASPVNQGRGYELNAIAAAVVGGCSLIGGVGTVAGTILGCVFLRVVIDSVARIIPSGADMYEGLIVGAVVVVAVTFSQLQQLWNSGQELFPGKLGVVSIGAMALLIWSFAAASFGMLAGTLIGGGTAVVLGAIKGAEMIRARRA